MKRFLSIILTAAMLMSATPAVFAENNAMDESVIVAEELNFENQEEVTENVTKDVSEEISGEGEENSEEQISLMSGENDISLMANETDEVQYSTDGSTWTGSSLSGAVTAIGTGTGTIKVLRDITISSKIEIAGNITLVANDKDVTITRAGTLTGVPVISVASGATLNLGTQTVMENTLTIDGGAVWSGNDGYPNTDAAQSTDKSNNTGVRGNFAIIRTDGTLNMYKNIILQNNHNNTSDAANHSGGGVDIENAGVFNMHGGKIWKCSSASQAEWGGGVTVAGLDYELKTPATFNLYGGEICYNSAGIGGGVSVGNPNSSHDHPAIFNMYNGNIHHNKVGSMDAYSGAGVYVADKAVFTMKDGSITENTAESKNGYALGGGVESVGTFNMSGGTISGNTAKSGGAGIFLMYNNNVDCEANITGGNIINNNGEGIFINDTKAYLNISGNVNISGNTTTGIYIEKDASPINIAGELTNTDAISVDSNINEDGTVIVTVSEGLNISNYVSKFQHKSKHIIVKDNKLVLGVEPEVEYTYSYYNASEGYVSKTDQGTLLEALTSINKSGNTGTIKLLKDIEIEDTIGASSNNKYKTVTLSDIDGNSHTITRADGFTGTMIQLGAYTCKVHNVTLDGQNTAGCDALIVAPAVGNSKGTHLILTDVTLCNNTNSAIKAGFQVDGTNVTIKNCSAKFGGAIYFESGAASAASVKFANSAFSSNSADTGSVAYVKSTGDNVFGVTFSGCTFSDNKYVADNSNTDKYTKNTLIYACTDTDKISWFNYVVLEGETSFSNNDVGADVMLDGGLGNMTIGGGDTVSGGLRIGDTFSTVSAIKVSVGSYERGTYKDGGLVVYLNGAEASNFSLVDVNGGTKIADDGKLFTVKQNGTSNYLVIGSPRKVYLNFYNKNTSYDTLNAYNNALNGVITLSVTPDFSEEQKPYSEKMIQTAIESTSYTITATGNNVKIISFYAQYIKGYSTTVKAEGTVNDSSATLNLSSEFLSAAADDMTYLPTVSIYVEYEMLTQPITLDTVTGGTISTTPTGSANVGSSVQLTATPNDDYDFVAWNVYKTGEPSTKVTVSGNSFTMPSYGVTVSASFTKKKHGVTITKDGEGTVTINSESPVEVGQTVKVTATPDEHWELSSLTMNGTDITSAKSFTMPNETVELKAVFVKSKFDVTVEKTENGTVSCDEKDKKVDWGTEIDFTVKPDDYYDIDTVTVNGNKVTPDADGNYKFTSEAENSTIKATFKKQQFALTDATTETNGTVSIMSGSTDVNKQKLDWGTSVTVTVAPKDNWEIDKVTINGKDISEFKDTVLHTMSLLSANAPTTYTVLIPTYDAELVVTYKKQQFGVTASATTNGTIDLLTESPLNWGENFTINVQADPHYEIDIVTVDGKTVTVNEQGDYTFEMPAHDVTVSAIFKKVKYTITGIGDHATFSIPSSDTYNWGDTVEFTVTPDKWYNIKSVYADNNTVVITPVANKENTYSFTMPQGNVVITTVTERPNFTVTFDSKGGSNITPKTVANGDAADKPGVPVWAGRGFAGWYTDESCTQKYDFTAPVTENITLYARWFLWGDVNNDGTVDSYDALLIRRCRAGLTDYSLIENRLAGFVNGFETGRNYPDSGDAVSIRRFRAGLINRYKVEDGAAGYEFDLENDTYIPKN